MNTEAALALWALSYAATDVEAQEWAAVASGRGATTSEIDHHIAARQALAVACTQLIGGAQVSNVGKTMVKGHGLQWEGGVVFDADGQLAVSRLPSTERHAKCRCGALSAQGISQYAAKAWHRQHKADVLAAGADQ